MALMINNLTKVRVSRTLKPLHQRSMVVHGAFLDETWDESVDIFPGCVATNLGNGVVTLATADTDAPMGLFVNFCAPRFGVNEVTNDYGREIGVAVLSPSSVVEVYAPAFDTTAAWGQAKADLAAKKPVYLKANAEGKLTIDGTNTSSAASVGQLYSVESDALILVAGLKNV